MITVVVKRANTDNRSIREVSISGHALYGDHGQDIVCAAVSAVSINLINAVEVIVGVPLDTQQEDGLIVCVVPASVAPKVAERVQLLMETLVFSLKSIAEEYPTFVTITDRKW